MPASGKQISVGSYSSNMCLLGDVTVSINQLDLFSMVCSQLHPFPQKEDYISPDPDPQFIIQWFFQVSVIIKGNDHIC